MRTRPIRKRTNGPERAGNSLLNPVPHAMAPALTERTSPSEDRCSMRLLTRVLGKEVALGAGTYWQAAQRAPTGPIDVIDIFSGCGGMSAGFRVVNGSVPLFNLVMALDLDPVANATYERNLGVRPLEEDVSALARNPKALKCAVERSQRNPDHPLILI